MVQQGEQVYNLKLDMLLTVLNANRQTCQIFTEVSFGTLTAAMGTGKLGRGRAKSASAIELSIQNGYVVSCVIREQSGLILTQGAEALVASRRCGELSWVVRPLQRLQQEWSPAQQSLTEHQLGESQPATEVWPGRSPPRRAHQLAQQELDTLPRKHRQVLLLIDGQRGIGELCRMLNCTSEQLAVILDELRSKELILL